VLVWAAGLVEVMNDSFDGVPGVAVQIRVTAYVSSTEVDVVVSATLCWSEPIPHKYTHE
jgi:hypothetical protein